jgi:hypothetical protein
MRFSFGLNLFLFKMTIFLDKNLELSQFLPIFAIDY